MEPDEKMTKQGVRDLNHLLPKNPKNPKKRPAAADADPAVAERLTPAPAPAAIPDGGALPTLVK
jgi:hypothetical protein